MKFSESWLREWVNPAVNTEELVSRLTMAGLEVDSVESASADFAGVVVGEIVACEPHPDADKLRVCQVAGNGEELLQVVCGASNARPGIKVPFATIGATLPGDFKIKRAKLRGVESFGMLCAEKELGVSEADEGLWELPADAPTGKNLRDYFNLDDQLVEVDLTPNRGDCLSIKGLSREVGVICKSDVNSLKLTSVAPVHSDVLPVSLEAEGACPRYIGRVIKNVDVSAESPAWLVEKLRRSGLRSIDPVVDITNYVLLELGQPMHAFDLDKLAGGVVVRNAKEKEQVKLLDGSEITLQEGTLVIADHSKVLAIAGVMGGEESAVSESARNLFLESAFFDPVTIAGKARSYGLHTDSSHRFERGVDPDLCIEAMERATSLLLEIVGGEPGPAICEELPALLPESKTVTLAKTKLADYLSVELDDAVVLDIFSRLGMELVASDEETWQLKIPSWRFDIAIDVDLIEEVARIYGYNNLPTTSMTAPISIRQGKEARLDIMALKSLLVDRGFYEAITYSFVDAKVLQALDPQSAFVEVRNPIASDMAAMRTSLWAGLLSAVRHNLSRQQSRARLFETGLRFLKGESLQQEPMIAGLIYGEREDELWSQNRGKVDFFDLKGHVEALCDRTGVPEEFSFRPAEHPTLHPGQSVALYKGEALVGYLGRLHPSVQKQLDIDQPVYLFELNSNILMDSAVPAYQPISRYPEVRRDIAIIVDKSVTANQITACVRSGAGSLLKSLRIFDVYEGKGIENNRKSMALGLTFQELSRTLNEEEVTASVDAVVKNLEVNYQATLRG